MANKEAPGLHRSPRTQHTLEPERAHSAQTEHEAGTKRAPEGSSMGPSGAPNFECSTSAMPTSSRSRRPPGGRGCRSPSGDKGQHLHGPLPTPAEAPYGDSIAGVAEKKSPSEKGAKIRHCFWLGCFNAEQNPADQPISTRKRNPLGCHNLQIPPSVGKGRQGPKGGGLPLSLLGEEWQCSRGTGGARGRLHYQDRNLGQTFCL